MQRGPWSEFLDLLPNPLRWVGEEVTRLVRWIDLQATRALIGLKTSPAWFFVTSVGVLSIGLTILLFISMAEPSTKRRGVIVDHTAATGRAGREQLEQTNNWATQDRWRIAHLFVSNKPAHSARNIRLDSRLLSVGRDVTQGNLSADRRSNLLANRISREEPIDVRLELNRPKQAQQDHRLIRGTVRQAGTQSRTGLVSRVRERDPRLLVQASWEFGSECKTFEYSGLPTRRPRPIPQPIAEPVVPLPPVRKTSPDLSYEMELIRQSPIAAAFPPGSYLVSRSDRSVFPMNDPRFQDRVSSNGHWHLFRSSHHVATAGPDIVPYQGIGIHEPLTLVSDSYGDFEESLPSATEIEIRVELSAPKTVSAGQVHHSKLFISNEGPESIAQVEVNDLIAQLQTVISADPDAHVVTASESQSGKVANQLHRELQNMAPGTEREFDLGWIPNDGRKLIHRVRVVAHAAVSAMTEVNRPPETEQPLPSVPPEKLPEQHPAIACDLQYFEKAYVGDEVELEITVRNTGDVPLHNVKVQIDVPHQLTHRDGKKVIFDAGNLQVRGQNQTVVKMSAREVGDAVHILQVASNEPIEARGKVLIKIVERGKVTPPLPETIPKPAPAKVITPIPSTQPASGCCCQQASVSRSESIRLIP